MSTRYFGTDGIRGPVDGPVLSPAFVRRLGYAVSRFLKKHNPAKPVTTIVVGRDTRESGERIEDWICEGLCAGGHHVYHAGVVPTPAVSMIVRDLHADLGIAITASHNPSTDNGIKFFNNQGHKFQPAAEEEIESIFEAEPPVPGKGLPTCGYDYDGRAFYTNHMRALLDQDCLRGWKIVLDTANGATAQTSPAVFRHLGADLTCLGNTPDGKNINAGVGSEHPQALVSKVRETGARLGVAHDGDGDRLVLCDETGSVVDGDEILGLVAAHMLRRNELKARTLVTTVQSNLGLDKAVERVGGLVTRVPVGDRNVLYKMLETGSNFGGENSGHIVFTDHSCSGDGLLAALKVIQIMLRTGQPLSILRKEVTLFPQVTANIRVREKKPIDSLDSLRAAMSSAEREFGNSGRILVRYSGTEPKIRLLVEGEDLGRVKTAMATLQEAVRKDLQVIA